MSLYHNPNMVTNGLVLCLDAGNTKSYPNTGTTWTDLSGQGNTGTLTNGPTFTSYEARTNGVANTTSGWSTLNCTLTPNSAVSPDGTTNATTITSTSTINSFAYPGTSSSSNTIYTVSIYAKQGTSPFVSVYDQWSLGGAWFNLSTGAVGSVSGSATASIVNAGNGWYRCIFTKDSTGVTPIANRLDIGLSDTAGSYSVTNGRTAYIYGVQREIGSFATSYIPTTSSPVTRSAGPATLVFDGVNDYVTCGISSSINAASTSLTWSCWFKSNSISTEQLLFSNANASITNGFEIEIYQSKMLLQVFPSQTYAFANTTLSSNTWYHLCVTYSSGTITYYLNGVNDGTTSRTFTVSTGPTYISSWAYSAGYFINGHVSSVLFYNTALTADQVLQNFNALRGRFGV